MSTTSARERYVRRQALIRMHAGFALSRGYVLNPDRMEAAARELDWLVLLRRRPRTAENLIRVTPEFTREHIDLADRPYDLWSAAKTAAECRRVTPGQCSAAIPAH